MCKARYLAGNKSPLAKLIAQGRATASKGDLLDVDPPAGEASNAVSEVLIADRDDRL